MLGIHTKGREFLLSAFLLLVVSCEQLATRARLFQKVSVRAVPFEHQEEHRCSFSSSEKIGSESLCLRATVGHKLTQVFLWLRDGNTVRNAVTRTMRTSFTDGLGGIVIVRVC